MTNPLISVVIPAFKQSHLLRRAITSALVQDLDPAAFEIIVVDSSPSHENVLLVAELASTTAVSLCCLAKKPEGPGPSRNLGVQNARGEFIAFLDSDCRATVGWLREGLAAFADGVGLVQGSTLPDPSATPGIFTHHISVTRENWLYETANIFYRRSALEAAGGFASDLNPRSEQPMGGEDVQVAWKTKRNGWNSRFAKRALVYHEVKPMPVWRWFLNKRLYIFPRLLREFPELRRFFTLYYFYDDVHAAYSLTIVALILGTTFPTALVLCAPYLFIRATEPTKTLRGVLRPLRIAAYLPRDTLAFVVLTVASIRFRRLLL